MKTFLLLAAVSIAGLAAPADAQSMDHGHMPGMKMPAKPAPAKAKPKPPAKPRPAAKRAPKPAPEPAPLPNAAQTPPPGDPACSPEHAAMGHCAPSTAPPAQTDPHASHGAGGTALPAGDAPAPAAPEPTYADRIWGREAMAGARADLRGEHGGGTFSQVMIDLAEYQVRDGRDGFRGEGEGWFGGDVDRLVVKAEGSGGFGEGVDDAEVQALYSRAVGPYFNLQAGVRYDIAPNPSRTYATVGFEGLAPYWFEVEGAVFVSDKGDVLARLEGYYDQRITQQLILQPRAELNLAAQDVPENGIGSGLSDIELGLRLRYEVAKEFAPYVGISWDGRIGDTADFARAAGEDPSSTSLVLGVRAWF